MISKHAFTLLLVLAASLLFSACSTPTEISKSPQTVTEQTSAEWQDEFSINDCTLAPEGSNDFFILEPGFQLVLEGGGEKLIITVLDETIEIDGTLTRVVEEREWRNEDLIEASYNFFAFCEQTKDIYYFGEDVDMYTAGQLSSHSGAWRAGVDDARPGIIMPGTPIVGMRYYQEIAPDVAMDRAEILSLEETYGTPAGNFEGAMKTKEGTALNPLEQEFKSYARGIGLIQDQNLLLTSYGFLADQ
jgi:hypothetical protein